MPQREKCLRVTGTAAPSGQGDRAGGFTATAAPHGAASQEYQTKREFLRNVQYLGQTYPKTSFAGH